VRPQRAEECHDRREPPLESAWSSNAEVRSHEQSLIEAAAVHEEALQTSACSR